MERIRGFRLKHRVAALFRLGNRRNRVYSGFRQFDPPASCRVKPISWFFSRLKTKAKSLCCAKRQTWFSGRGYVPLDDRPLVKDKAAASVPKGHMAVYVGQKDGNFHRFLVPVMYFNHPLFGELLRDSEEEFGFNHPGGITIPCRVSEFESVQTQVAATVRGSRKLITLKKTSR